MCFIQGKSGSEIFSESLYKVAWEGLFMYSHFGFTGNIFNTDPLELNQEDLKKFVGRVQDIKSFAVDISSTDSAVIVVTGHRGVGKTSFVNVMEYAIGFRQPFFKKYIKVDIPNLIPCYHKIQLEPDESMNSILSKGLSSLLFSVKCFSDEKKLRLPKEIKRLSSLVSELVLSKTQGGSVTLFGSGASVSHSKQYKGFSDLPTNVLEHKIQEVVQLIKKAFRVDGIMLNINNVDILEEKKVYNFFNQLRDYLFNIKGLWVIIIGQPGFYSSLAQQATRVAEVISGQETRLAPLSEADVINVLKIRQKVYSKLTRNFSPLPIEEDFIKEIYKHSDGEIRTVFKACDDIVRSTFKKNPNVKNIPASYGKTLLKNILEQQLSLESMKSKDQEIIREIFKKGFLRPKDHVALKLKSAVDFTNKARPLILKNFLKKEVRGNTAKYKATGVIHLANYSGIKI